MCLQSVNKTLQGMRIPRGDSFILKGWNIRGQPLRSDAFQHLMKVMQINPTLNSALRLEVLNKDLFFKLKGINKTFRQWSNNRKNTSKSGGTSFTKLALQICGLSQWVVGGERKISKCSSLSAVLLCWPL